MWGCVGCSVAAQVEISKMGMSAWDISFDVAGWRCWIAARLHTWRASGPGVSHGNRILNLIPFAWLCYWILWQVAQEL